MTLMVIMSMTNTVLAIMKVMTKSTEVMMNTPINKRKKISLITCKQKRTILIMMSMITVRVRKNTRLILNDKFLGDVSASDLGRGLEHFSNHYERDIVRNTRDCMRFFSAFTRRLRLYIHEAILYEY